MWPTAMISTCKFCSTLNRGNVSNLLGSSASGVTGGLSHTWGDYSTKLIDYRYLPHARLRINNITM